MKPKINLSRSPVPIVQLSTLWDTASSSLSAVKSNNPALAKSIVALSNQSDQPIVAISALWRIRDASGREERTRHKCDAFLPASQGKVIVDSRSTLYFGPNTCLVEPSSANDLSKAVTTLERGMITLLANAAEVDIVVDGVMFQNGDMFAVDASYANEITERVAAAHFAAAHVRSELARGKTKPQALESLSTLARSTFGKRGEWINTFGNTLSGRSEQMFDAYLASMERLKLPGITVHTY